MFLDRIDSFDPRIFKIGLDRNVLQDRAVLDQFEHVGFARS